MSETTNSQKAVEILKEEFLEVLRAGEVQPRPTAIIKHLGIFYKLPESKWTTAGLAHAILGILRKDGLVRKNGKDWELTDAGRG